MNLLEILLFFFQMAVHSLISSLHLYVNYSVKVLDILKFLLHCTVKDAPIDI